MKNLDTHLHVKGESVYLDDIPEMEGTLQGVLLSSPLAHGRIRKLNPEKAAASPGVAAVITAKDIPGENQIGGIILDEPLFAADTVHYRGQPIALVVAESRRQAAEALKLMEIEIDPLPVVTDPRIAYSQGQLIAPERTFLLGDPEAQWEKCDYVVEGRADSGAQEHFYLETQGALALPLENGAIRLYSSTQSPTAVQKTTAKVLGVPMRKVEVDVRRLGGGFGGKEDQATPWAVMAALACLKLDKPVKVILRRHEDMRITGKRHPYSSDFKIGLSRAGKILAYQVKFYQNAGAAADLSTAILERTLFHTTNSYYIPHVKAQAVSCRTHLPPFTAFRGFGGPQAMFVLESAIYKAADRLGVEPRFIQKQNLLNEGDTFPYGMAVENSRARVCWQEAEEKYNFAALYKKAQDFNSSNRRFKKGVAVMPVCFGISFTNTTLNQGRALVHVYTDGSVSVSTGAVEMGQGVNMKILQVAARTFSIDPERIQVETTNTKRVVNTSPTAASSGADLNGKAAELACFEILARLKQVAVAALGHADSSHIEIRDEWIFASGKKTSLHWQDLVQQAYTQRIDLSAHAHYATPRIHFDRSREKGQPFAYHVFGSSITEVTLDCLRGTYILDAVRIVHDVGKSLNPLIDQGQVEGGLLQGLGWMTIEEFLFDEDGRIITDTTSSYKVPDLKFTPKEIQLEFLEHADNPYAVLSSKAVGEPPFMYGLGSYFAILNALRAFNPKQEPFFHAPMTPEKVLTSLYPRVE